MSTYGGKSITLQQHIAAWNGCVKCAIGAAATNHVFYRGIVPCDVVFVGEAPGRQEDERGLPFVGESGTSLDDWIWRAQNTLGSSFSYAITNLVCCRPTEGKANRRPTNAEIDACGNRLREFILRIAKPKVLVAVGKTAAENVPEWEGLPVVALRHPAYFLYSHMSRTSLPYLNQVDTLVNFLKVNL